MEFINKTKYDKEWVVEFTLSLANTPIDRLNAKWVAHQLGIKRVNQKMRQSLALWLPACVSTQPKVRRALDGIIADEWNEDLEYFKEIHPHSKKREVFEGDMLRDAPHLSVAEFERRYQEPFAAHICSFGLRDMWKDQERRRETDRGTYLKRCPVHGCGIFHYRNTKFCSRRCRDKIKKEPDLLRMTKTF